MSRIYKIIASLLFMAFAMKPHASYSQCYEDFYVYQSYPYGRFAHLNLQH
jgi:hypothetical protein